MSTQAQTLADAFEFTRKYALGYYEKLKEKDIYKEFEVENKKLNSVYWLMGHLAVTENYLLLRASHGEIVRFAWARPFGLGGSMPAEADRVPIAEILTTMEQVHNKAMTHIRSLTDEQLAQPCYGDLKFGDGSVKSIILHAIRHEGTHAGHLGWLCKLHGIKNI
ncbi:MAG TPA: DinB family protein [Flavobacteriales bacterium]|nr:DinB family protein [Flavobacteriales bacterium]